MPRQNRLKSKTGIYHVILRGINKQDIFFDEQDRFKFLNETIRYKEKHSYEIYTYCLMPNHIHLEIKESDNNLGKIMQSLTVSYSSYFNKRYERIGHLFQNRYFSRPVENKDYFLKLHRYIHQNPEKAAICKMEDYKWSSYKSYIYDKDYKLTDKELIISNFTSLEELKRFNQEKNSTNKYNDFLEFEIRNRFTDEEVIEIIKDRLKINNIQNIQKYNKKSRDEILKRLIDIKGITKSQLSRILGINKKLIERTFRISYK